MIPKASHRLPIGADAPAALSPKEVSMKNILEILAGPASALHSPPLHLQAPSRLRNPLRSALPSGWRYGGSSRPVSIYVTAFIPILGGFLL